VSSDYPETPLIFLTKNGKNCGPEINIPGFPVNFWVSEAAIVLRTI
jgi:hypothetical protein